MIIERLGRFRCILGSGLHIIIPFLDEPRRLIWVKAAPDTVVGPGGVQLPYDGGSGGLNVESSNRVDLRETVLDIPQQPVITKDNVNINIDALLYVQITSPRHAAYEIANLPKAISQLAQTSLRNVIGEMDLDESLISRDVINSKLKTILDEATDKWGTKVNRVELKNITPPEEIQNAMEKQMQAERERRAKVLEAEGDKQSRIARSEGQRQEDVNLADGDKMAKVLQAEGEAEAIRRIADAKREAIEKVKEAFNGDCELSSKYLIATSYVETLDRFTQKAGDKVYVPYEASTVLTGVGSIKDLLLSKPT